MIKEQQMREIKFRAWDTERNVMTPPEKICHLDGETTKGLSESAPFWKLMQYTGLKDCEGKEIYEGDILYNGEERTIVWWNEHIGAWAISDSDCCAEWLVDYVESEEVIGNIYENPELVV